MTPDVEEVWQGFTAFVATAENVDKPRTLITDYFSSLLAGGASPEEADEALKIVNEQLRNRSDGWAPMFNRIYSSEQFGFSTNPNRLLVVTVEGLNPGRALDAGMGQGRNSVYLALIGWDVIGFDVSDEGVAAALRSAAEAGVQVDGRVENYVDFDYGSDTWDLIVITYEPFPVTDHSYVRRLSVGMRSGGLLVIESFASPADADLRRPVDIDPIRLRDSLEANGFDIVRFEEVEEVPDWDPEPTRLVRAIARRP